jgi:uncharacterized linocin/CFP29 family protein
VLQYQTMSDINAASVNMDGISQGDSDRPLFNLAGLPLPIIHKDFQFSAREVYVSRNSNTPIDTAMAEMAARKVAEEAEKMLLGVSSDFSFGGNLVQGYTTFTSRLTKTLTDPASAGWTGSVLVDEVIEMRQQSVDANYRGPWMLYVSSDWDPYLDADYSMAKGDITLRDRIARIRGISGIETLDYLPAQTMILIQMTSDVIREVVGMEVSTMQWTSHGGMQLNFKVMAIMVPQLRADYLGQTGIVHGSYS